MKDQPLFSIVTVVFNDADNLEKTIKSVLNQTCRNFEYIVVDGGSKDGTLDIIKKYEQHITTWSSGPDKGIYDAMNKGIKTATGKFINFLNAGDLYYNPDVLSKVAAELNKAPQVELLYGQAVRLSSETSSLKFVKGGKITTNSLFTSIPFCHQAIFYQTTLFHEIGLYDFSYRVTADYQWLIRYYNARKSFDGMLYFDSNVVEYIEGGFSFQNINKAAKEKLRIAREEFQKPHRTKGIIAFSCYYYKAFAIEWLGKMHLLEGYRQIKYRLLNKAISS